MPTGCAKRPDEEDDVDNVVEGTVGDVDDSDSDESCGLLVLLTLPVFADAATPLGLLTFASVEVGEEAARKAGDTFTLLLRPDCHGFSESLLVVDFVGDVFTLPPRCWLIPPCVSDAVVEAES